MMYHVYTLRACTRVCLLALVQNDSSNCFILNMENAGVRWNIT